MLIETRVWDKINKKMTYLPPLQVVRDAKGFVTGVVALSIPQGDVPEEAMASTSINDPIMMKSPILAENKEHIWEGDILDCGIVTSFGLVKDQGIMVWRPDKGGFVVEVGRQYEGRNDFHISGIERKGNLFENPELIKAKIKKDDTKTL